MWKLTYEDKKIVAESIIWKNKNSLPVRNAEIDGSLIIKNGDVLNEFKPISEITQNDAWICIFRVGSRVYQLDKVGW